MKRWIVLLAIVPGILLGQEPADNSPFVEVTVLPEAVAVGEELRLEVVVLAPTWFPKAPVFPNFELSNTITRLPPNSSRSTSRRIGRDNWSGVQRSYAIYPLVGANFRLEDLSVKVTYANPDGFQPVTVEIPVPPIAFSATVPAGAEGLDPYIAGTSFILTREVEGETKGLEAGDALVVRYVAELEGLPAIFIPGLLAVDEVPGVSVYPESPRIEEGDVARRTEKITYVFENGGEFTAPAISLDWWNTETQTIETATIEPMSVSVDGPSIAPSAEPEPDSSISWWFIIGAIGGIAVLALLARIAWRRLPGLLNRWRQWRKKMKAPALPPLNPPLNS